jgi:hypothetical protein
VKSRFQNSPFKCNLQRYIAAGSSGASNARRAERLAMAEAFLQRIGATAAAVDRAVTGKKKKNAAGGGDGGDDVARLIDAADNEFVMSNPKSGATVGLSSIQLAHSLIAPGFKLNSVYHIVALQVEFERKTLKPVFHLIGYKLWV